MPKHEPVGTSQRVLIVDDNEDVSDMLAEFLRRLGHEVETAPDGVHALSLADRFHPQVALLDIGMPVMDGYELAARLRERFGEDAPQMIAVTGYGQDHDRRRSMRSGFADHLVKPVEFSVLVQSIEGVVQARKSSTTRE